MTSIPRPEYPRPQFVRAEWMNLNGTWEFEFDDDDHGLGLGWQDPRHHLGRQIEVPFPFEARDSGIGDPSVHEIVWYKRRFTLPVTWNGRRIRLHFSAVDFQATVWVNGQLIGIHRGGYTPFAFDITDALQAGLNVVTVRVYDGLTLEQPRGKQTSSPTSYGIWYTRCTGIWQTVWLEPVSDSGIKDWLVETDIERGDLTVRVWTGPADGLILHVTASIGGQQAGSAEGIIYGRTGKVRMQLNPLCLWSPDDPKLYSLTLSVTCNGAIVDQAECYAGLREVSTRNGMMMINGIPFYQRLVLDQAYWPDGVYTAPSDKAIRRDVEWVKRLGFNGVRKHQITSDPRFLYWADRLGILIWADMPGQTISDPKIPEVRVAGQAEANLIRELSAYILRDRNHPSIIAWVPFNESWGIKGVSKDAATRAFLLDVIRIIRGLDPTRLIVDNSGYEHSEETDIFALHDYAESEEETNFPMRLSSWSGPGERMLAPYSYAPLLLPRARYLGQPIVLSEYGGLGLIAAGENAPQESFSYDGTQQNASAFLARYRELREVIAKSAHIAGYCYTQLTDVEQEINGLLSFHRRPKVSSIAIRELNNFAVEEGKEHSKRTSEDKGVTRKRRVSKASKNR